MRARFGAILPFAVIFVVVTWIALPMLTSGDKLNLNSDFFQYAARHEAVRQSVLRYHTLPLRSHWLGGGYPTIGDPEDPTLNPLVGLSVVFGAPVGIKLISYLGMLTGGLATYAFAHGILGYTRWGALFSGLVYGSSLFFPVRLADGNVNEVACCLLPLCLLLLGRACRGRKGSLVLLPFVLYTMLSDGKLTALMAMFFIAALCAFEMIPRAAVLPLAGGEGPAHRPLKLFLVALTLTGLIGMVRILPVQDLAASHGGIEKLIVSRPKTYESSGILSFSRQRLRNELVGRRVHQATVGWTPVALGIVSLLLFWRQMLPWTLSLLLFSWLAMADNAWPDLLRLAWHLPVFNAIYRPDKYFGFQIVFIFAIAAGRCFSLLRARATARTEQLLASALIACAVGFLAPHTHAVIQRAYTYEAPVLEPSPDASFFNVAGQSIPRARYWPSRALAFFNLQRDVGTIDWYTGIPLPEHAIAKYFVNGDDEYIPNPAYLGEAFFAEGDGANAVTTPPALRPNSIAVAADVRGPGLLVVNQNYHRDWRTDHGKLVDRDGLLAVRLEESGRYTIQLQYRPWSFYAGLAVTMATLVGLAVVCWAYRTARLHSWAAHGQPAVRRTARALLWLAS